MWTAYQRLLEGVPSRRRVAECIVGLVWTLVRTTDGDAGLSLTFRQGLDESGLPGAVAGSDLRAIASHLTSWNYYEAAIGAAAVNSIYNTRAHVERIAGRPLEELTVSGSGVFEKLSKRFSGGRVAVIGHFPAVDVLALRCRVIVLERRPELGDLPDPACEDLLPGQDLVCITGASVTNKTLPRLLALSRNAYTVLVGPSTPLSPVWFDFGVDLLAGAVISEPMQVRRSILEGAHRRVFREGLTTVEIPASLVTAASRL